MFRHQIYHIWCLICNYFGGRGGAKYGIITMMDKNAKREVSPYGRRLRELRKARGWSQAALSRMVPCSAATIAHAEYGFVSRPSIVLGHRLAELFGVTVEELTSPASTPDPDHGEAALVA
jgi:DNA-binding XRE family transcriptional regulator